MVVTAEPFPVSVAGAIPATPHWLSTGSYASGPRASRAERRRVWYPSCKNQRVPGAITVAGRVPCAETDGRVPWTETDGRYSGKNSGFRVPAARRRGRTCAHRAIFGPGTSTGYTPLTGLGRPEPANLSARSSVAAAPGQVDDGLDHSPNILNRIALKCGQKKCFLFNSLYPLVSI
jgi:hypothetical protein